MHKVTNKENVRKKNRVNIPRANTCCLGNLQREKRNKQGHK